MRRQSEQSQQTENIVERAAIDPSPYIARGRMLHAEAVQDAFARLLGGLGVSLWKHGRRPAAC